MSRDTLQVNGWTIYAHPLFLDQAEALMVAVEKAKAKDPEGFRRKRDTKLLAALFRIAFEEIPQDPTRDAYRQGATLGAEYKHWFRAKFLQQYRLFFRYQRAGSKKIIVLAWINDENTLRAYGRKTDAYATFRKMITSGNPPDDWDKLLKSAASEAAQARLKRSRRPPT